MFDIIENVKGFYSFPLRCDCARVMNIILISNRYLLKGERIRIVKLIYIIE